MKTREELKKDTARKKERSNCAGLGNNRGRLKKKKAKAANP